MKSLEIIVVVITTDILAVNYAWNAIISVTKIKTLHSSNNNVMPHNVCCVYGVKPHSKQLFSSC